MIQISIDTGQWWRRKKRRALPSSWDEVPQARLLRCLHLLMYFPRTQALPYIVQEILQVPAWILARMNDDDTAAILHHFRWMEIQPTVKPIIPAFTHAGVTYHLPAEKFSNGVALEYPLADEFYTKFVQNGDEDALLSLVATLCREPKQDQTEITRTGDIRVPLLSRTEVEARAKRLKGCPLEYQMVVLFYFAGIKTLIHRVYKRLFENDEEQDESTPSTAKTAPPMFGWWGIYMDVAENITNLDKVYQMNFHTLCMSLVKRRKEAQDRELQMRMNSPNFAQ